MTGVPPKFLVGAHEIAEGPNPSQSSGYTMRKTHADRLAPVANLKIALIWDWRAVERWAKLTGRELK